MPWLGFRDAVHEGRFDGRWELAPWLAAMGGRRRGLRGETPRVSETVRGASPTRFSLRPRKSSTRLSRRGRSGDEIGTPWRGMSTEGLSSRMPRRSMTEERPSPRWFESYAERDTQTRPKSAISNASQRALRIF